MEFHDDFIAFETFIFLVVQIPIRILFIGQPHVDMRTEVATCQIRKLPFCPPTPDHLPRSPLPPSGDCGKIPTDSTAPEDRPRTRHQRRPSHRRTRYLPGSVPMAAAIWFAGKCDPNHSADRSRRSSAIVGFRRRDQLRCRHRHRCDRRAMLDRFSMVPAASVAVIAASDLPIVFRLPLFGTDSGWPEIWSPSPSQS